MGRVCEIVNRMTLSEELTACFPDYFRILILDNEVTVDAFVTDPPLPWARLTAVDGRYGVGAGYPSPLTMDEADREELNWDTVSQSVLCSALEGIGEAVDLIAFGNNAGQGMPLAQALPERLRSDHGAIIYGSSLPEQAVYEAAGYRQFCARADLLSLVSPLAAAAGRPPALAFINTIEHNQQNYHAPWSG